MKWLDRPWRARENHTSVSAIHLYIHLSVILGLIKWQIFRHFFSLPQTPVIFHKLGCHENSDSLIVLWHPGWQQSLTVLYKWYELKLSEFWVLSLWEQSKQLPQRLILGDARSLCLLWERTFVSWEDRHLDGRQSPEAELWEVRKCIWKICLLVLFSPLTWHLFPSFCTLSLPLVPSWTLGSQSSEKSKPILDVCFPYIWDVVSLLWNQFVSELEIGALR